MEFGFRSYSAWGSAADAAVQADGVNLSQYNRKVYVMPSKRGGLPNLLVDKGQGESTG
jgi:hypothetical protein